jgi:hypothetical protein
LNTFSQGHARQDPGVNSKKKPDSDEEEKEEEEVVVAAALENNVHMHVIIPNKD